MPPNSAIRKVAVLGDYLPRKCGIATLAPQLIGMSGWLYTAIPAVMGFGFIVQAFRLYRTRDDKAMRKAGIQV